MAEKILTTEFSEEMQKSYLDYSMSVITSRAVPDIRDGLKPVQRRVLYDMNELHVHSDRPTLKSARICGDTMGKYHPHGDASIYETLVVLAQDFKRMQPLVQGQGNFGSIEGDSAAAPRYTEARLQRFTDEVMLRDLETTVPFQPNYDEKLREPEVLPARIPYFLLNGSEGIAVGMTTSAPSHNLSEIIDLVLAYLKNPAMETREMLHYLPGPDFPTGGIIANRSELLDIYRTGSGKLKLRGKLVFEKRKGRSDKDKLIVTEIPYTMIGQGIMKFMQDTAALVEEKKLPEITDISNQSDKDGIRIVLELKSGADIDRITNILYKKTKLEDSFGVNMLAIVKGRPEVLSLRGILREYLSFQYQLIEQKYQKLLEKELLRKEIQEGLIRAVDCIDAIIALLRSSQKQEEAKKALMGEGSEGIRLRERDREYREQIRDFRFTERQAQAILDMKLSKLIGLELLALQREYRESLKSIKEYRGILSSRERANELLAQELSEIRERYFVPRRTLLEDGKDAVYDESAVEEMQVVYVQDRFGYVKLLDETVYQRNQEALLSESRFLIPCKNTDRILLFTDQGRLHQIRLLDVPLGKFRDKGVPIDNISKYSASEEEILFAAAKAELSGKELLFVSQTGLAKRVPSEEFDTANRLVSATKLQEGDRVASVLFAPKESEEDLVLQSEASYFLRFPIKELPLQKKNAKGVLSMKLGRGDRIRSALLIAPGSERLSTEKGELMLSRLKQSHRGGRGTKH